ncbi:MAG: hypothetical protein PHU53_00395 [Thermoplasmata archaeon]|nr:hypothetical protein [Thermoplasmata archaeon]
MTERMLRKSERVTLRRPLPPPRAETVQPLPQRPILAATGMPQARMCSVCLGKMAPGTVMTYCECGKFFHIGCISKLGECPLCKSEIRIVNETSKEPDVLDDIREEEEAGQEEDGYQCPECLRSVDEFAGACECGAVFDTDKEDIYVCPGCGNEVKPDFESCPFCLMRFG